MPKTHRLDAGAETVHWGYFDAKLPPLLTIDSGDTITISTVSGGREVMPPPPLEVPEALAAVQAHVPMTLPGHMCTGPVAIKGAKAGQVLEVRIKAIELHYDWGYNFSGPLLGRAAGRLSRAASHAHHARPEENDGTAALGPGAAVAAVLRRDGGGAACGLGQGLDAAAPQERRQPRQQGAGGGHARSICPSTSTARCSRSATATARRATARCA